MVIAGYPVISYKDYDYMRLFDGNFIRKSNAGHYQSFYEKIITVDTETYVSDNEDIGWITDWTITIENDSCLYGNHVRDLINTIDRICDTLHADKEHTVRFYIHNLSYDYMFLRNHLLYKFGVPDRKLALKTHRYVFMQWQSFGIEIRDSAILTQRTLERLCKDMGTLEKATGTWDYKKKRTPESMRTVKELAYVCVDTICLCKALRLYLTQRNVTVATAPLTNTGFIRNQARSRSRKDKKWHKKFMSMQLSLDQYELLTACYHGGYTHANRYYVNQLITEPVECYDFTSSYPARIVYEKFPMTNFVPTKLSLHEIMELKEDYCFAGYVRLKKLRLKKDHPMPPLAFHKAKVCLFPDADKISKKKAMELNLDNGKIVNADLVIYPFTDPDLQVIFEAYDFEWADVANVIRAKKDYLPDWIINYVIELFEHKNTLKHADPVLYMISKGELNGIYGMMVQKMIQSMFEEDYETGIWSDVLTKSEYEEKLQKYYNSRNSFLPYQWGVWVTAYAQAELFELGKCCKRWMYSDTDSVKGTEWDRKKLAEYNEKIMKKSEERGIGTVLFNGESHTLGIAEFDGIYEEFKTMGSKRYCYREKGKLKQTVAGVPKDGVYCLDDNINNFEKGFIYRNSLTYRRNYRRANNWKKEPSWKLKTEYIYKKGINKITVDGCKIEYGCAIRLSDTEYELDHTIPYDKETGLPLPFESKDILYS